MHLWRHHNREQLLAEPFPEGWDTAIERNVAHFELLNKEEQASLRQIVKVVVAEKNWEGCQDLVVTDEMKVTIAAQAGLMLLGMEHDYFDRVPTILIYPSGFSVPTDRWQQGGGFAASGQAVYRGPVILAWDEVQAEGRHPARGNNVVIHEFAHQLDFLDGYMDGTPEVADPELARRWEQVIAREYKNLLHDLRSGHRTILGEYAGTNKTEFFAVACERFFTIPEPMRASHPELYELLANFFRIDPTRWFRAGV